MLDTTYLLPLFGVDVNVDSSASIQATLGSLRDKGTTIYISDLSPFEAFIKSYRIAERMKDNAGKEEAKLGLVYLSKGGWALRVDHHDEEIIEEAFKIRSRHNDPFDCFIFATSKSLKAPLVTEDESAEEFLGENHVLTWGKLKRSLQK